jgi:hypothetical protein
LLLFFSFLSLFISFSLSFSIGGTPGVPLPKNPKMKKISTPSLGPDGEKKPGNRKGAASWTAQEDNTLKHMKEVEKKSWKTISEEGFQSKRTAVACMNHYSSSVRQGAKRINAAWTPEEKEKLRSCREKGESWKETAKSFVGRTWNAVRLHYVLHLDGKTRTYTVPSSVSKGDKDVTDGSIGSYKKKGGGVAGGAVVADASGVISINTTSSSSSSTVQPNIPLLTHPPTVTGRSTPGPAVLTAVAPLSVVAVTSIAPASVEKDVTQISI